MGQVQLDDKYRVLLDRKTRQIAGLKRGERMVAIPFRGGVMLVAPRGRRFSGSLSGFDFKEQRHEASRFLFRRKT